MYITYCSRKKNTTPGFIPAIQRYDSERISGLYNKSLNDNVPFAILSGKYGLVTPEQPIPWYDHLLTLIDISIIKERIISFILNHNIRDITYFTPQTQSVVLYREVLVQACNDTGVTITVEGLNKNV